MKPIIGITSFEEKKQRGPYVTVNNFYANAVSMAGGVPVILPTVRSLEDASFYERKLDGLLITGGNENVSPMYYAQGLLKETECLNPARDKWELALLEAFTRSKKPVLGICRGCQLINVYRGGSLYWDVHSEYDNCKGHWAGETEMCYPVHYANVMENTLLGDIFKKERIAVNSYHYQAIKFLGEGLVVSAKADDGVIEAIEDSNYPFLLGIQWHPEAMVNEELIMQNIFKAFIEASDVENN